MQWFWRYPMLPVGLVLIVLGVGNWSVSQPKVAEYTRRASAPDPIDTRSSFADFARLTARTNSGVLEGLHRGTGDYGDAEAKRDLYTVLDSGGRFIAMLGLLLAGIGLIQHWRHRGPARADGTSGWI
ncbi:hypothetical protein KF840_22650 [bacterium]|nr:hypothetical protein [bacterium]